MEEKMLRKLLLVSVLNGAYAFENKSSCILDLILQNALTKDIDKCFAGLNCSQKPLMGKDALLKKIQHIIKKKKPLIFTCVGFPFKSTYATNCVIGKLPDMAERQGLLALNNFIKQVNKIYPAKLILYTDGLAFAKDLGITAKEVLSYETHLKILAKDLSYLSIKTMQDLYPDKTPEDLIHLVDTYALEVPSVTEGELSTWHRHLSKELGKNADKKTNEILCVKSAAFSKLLKEKHYPKDLIRLSVHFSHNLSEKIGFALTPQSNLTPWHGVAVKEKGFFKISSKKEVLKKKLTYETINGIKCPFYQ